MKKLSFLVLIIMCLIITGCGNKEKVVISTNKFDTTLIRKGFNVQDNTKEYNTVDYILESKKGVYSGVEIEMVVYTSNEYAKKVHDSQIESFNLLKSTGAFEEKEKGSNFYKYILVSNGRYMISTRVDNTLVFCKTLLENKELIESIYSELGY